MHTNDENIAAQFRGWARDVTAESDLFGDVTYPLFILAAPRSTVFAAAVICEDEEVIVKLVPPLSALADGRPVILFATDAGGKSLVFVWQGTGNGAGQVRRLTDNEPVQFEDLTMGMPLVVEPKLDEDGTRDILLRTWHNLLTTGEDQPHRTKGLSYPLLIVAACRGTVFAGRFPSAGAFTPFSGLMSLSESAKEPSFRSFEDGRPQVSLFAIDADAVMSLNTWCASGILAKA